MKRSLRRLGAVIATGAALAVSLAFIPGTANAAPAKGSRMCKPSDVTFRQEQSVFLQAKKDRSCYLKGYISRVHIRDAKGHDLGLKIVKDKSRRVRKVLVREGEYRAEFSFYDNGPGGTAHVVTPASLTFRLPGAKHDSKVEWTLGDVCTDDGGAFHYGPVQTTSVS